MSAVRHLVTTLLRRNTRTVATRKPAARARLRLESLEARDVPTTGITSWFDATSAVPYVAGDHRIQVTFAASQIQVTDQATGQAEGIPVTDGAQTQADGSIPRTLIPIYGIVPTGDGTNRLEVVERGDAE